MEFQDFVCDKIKSAGDVKAKKMFGTYNICLDGVNLGVLCVNKWYLKKTAAGDAYIKENGIILDTGIKDNSYIVTDFFDEKKICELAKITRNEIIKSKG
jgi:hypothetical protein